MKYGLIYLLSFAFCMLANADYAQSASLEGVWKGGGYIKPESGEREKVRCRVTYHKHTSKVYEVVATCASAELKIRQTGSLSKVRDDRYVGDFYNSEWDISGRVRVIIKGSRQTVIMKSSWGTGTLNLKKR